ncbi:MAG TPA: flavodoxin family protein [Clostridiales bacterium]|nr:flavodoxin family protein [Clostridiales bacterium]
MRRVLILNGSPRRTASSTMVVTRAFAEGIAEGCGEAEFETVNVSDLRITPCRGCLSCWGRTAGKCVIVGDDVPALIEKIRAADLLIVSFPLYFFGMPGEMKLLVDRLLPLMSTYRGQLPPKEGESYHGFRFPDPGKRLVLVSSCAYSDAAGVYDPLLSELDCILGRERYTPILCPQLKTLVDMGDTAPFRRAMKKYRTAGRTFAERTLTKKEIAALAKPPFSEGIYRDFLATFWAKEEAKSSSHGESLSENSWKIIT